ncbi:hypothetical protein PO878_12560 [Iamia majanohamensis]|uniref:DSBA-like thioredoxin domain-containing protein n=1 Tax=Iamia majanohamensis TaxID=467976 RepID=A0AAE9Y6M3_9ACTN|nr:hypothetical protein [Iamia majanohamensis]WCO65328.1 hypothetical protein PO878_12560 [Iamia majanohamensis]
MADVELFWDPVCPFCWVTSRWVRQVQEVRDLTVGWRLISLRFLNEPIGYDDRPPFYPAVHARGTELLRVAAAVRDDHGAEAVGPLYEALGGLLWETPAPRMESGRDMADHQLRDLDLPSVLEGLGLDPTHAEAATSEAWDEAIRAETEEATGRVGGDVGTPIITLDPPDGPSFFGPVISEEPPTAEEAGAAWDAMVTLARWPGFSELKRTLRSVPVTALTAPFADQTTRMR